MEIESGDLCIICASKRCCRRCHRHLDEHSFSDNTTYVCNVCSRRHRSALNSTYNEVIIPLSTNTNTFEAFLLANHIAIDDVITEALNSRRLDFHSFDRYFLFTSISFVLFISVEIINVFIFTDA